MNAYSQLPALAPIPRRKAKPDKGARGRANPRRILATVEVEVPVLDRETGKVAFVTEKAEAYVRDLPDVLKVLPEALRRAALEYAKAIEDVEAGGASDPDAPKGGKSSPAIRKEGRQFHAVRQVTHLRRIEAAIGGGMICLGPRRGETAGVSISHQSILRAIALDGLSVAGLLAALRLGRTSTRRKVLLSSILGSTRRIAADLGYIEPEEKTREAKKPVDGPAHPKAGPIHGPERAPGERGSRK